MNLVGQAMFFLLPAFAAILKLAYRRRLYVHHLVFSVYLHCFVFLLVAVVATPEAVGLDRVAAVTDLGLLWVPPYLLLGMRRFYTESLAKTVVKFGFVSVAYFILWTLTMAVLMLYSLMTF